MAADSAACCPWDALPAHVQERILSRLPLTALIPVAAVSRALRRLLRSPAFHALLSQHRLDAFFLLSPRLAFHPLSRRLLQVPTSPPLDPSCPPLISSASPSFLVTADSLLRLPVLPDRSYLIAVVVPPSPSSSSSRDYTLVAVTTNGAAVRSYSLDSADPSPRWVPGAELPLPFAILGNAAVASDRSRLFVLGRGPDALLVLDLETGKWAAPPVVIPHGLTTAHLFVLDDRLFLVGGVERLGVLERVVVWQLDNDEAVGWVEVATMPSEVFTELVADRHGSFWHFQAADRMGTLCLYNAVDGRLVMFDAVDCVWTMMPRVSGLGAGESQMWFGHVLEPGVELLLGERSPCS
ncbi:F-box only protein 6-like [Triticum dicoccoides]|uniref:F-box only protein 6-like n=1 Tax=Triticum dicoccoides TaxID=85692 RepID=UPI000E7A7658|nr:F-box only protein 6-like [Triticum dicoccoides]